MMLGDDKPGGPFVILWRSWVADGVAHDYREMSDGSVRHTSEPVERGPWPEPRPLGPEWREAGYVDLTTPPPGPLAYPVPPEPPTAPTLADAATRTAR